MFVISISANGTKVFPFCLFPHRSSDSMTTTMLRTSFVIYRYGKISYIAASAITTTAAATAATTTVIIIIVHFPSIHIYPFLVENKGQKRIVVVVDVDQIHTHFERCSRVKTGDKGQQSVECFLHFPEFLCFLLCWDAFVIRFNGNMPMKSSSRTSSTLRLLNDIEQYRKALNCA